MKKGLLFFLVLLVVAGSVFSADLSIYPQPLEGGSILVDAGAGYALSDHRNASMQIPPIIVSADYCLPVGLPISIGGLLAFYRFNFNTPLLTYSSTWTYMTFGARANWHWNLDVSQLDLYTGVFVGYNFFYDDSKMQGHGKYVESGMKFGGQAGMHYYFTDSVGAVVEVGYPFIAKAGVAFKF